MKNQHQLNQEIERLIQERDAAGGRYTPEDIALINLYEGSGGLANQGAEVGEGLLYEFYTPEWLCGLMWQLAHHHGYDGGAILEPACATGRLFRDAPKSAPKVGFETNPVTARIAEINYPNARIINDYFETAFIKDRALLKNTWLPEYPFSLVIGNPPYGIYKNRYSSYFSKEKFIKQIEIFFIYKGVQMLKKGGLLVYLQSQNFLRNGQKYNQAKDKIGELADLIDAYRLPKIFKNSDVPTDIMILKRK